ncbi:hypothetical protein [Neolewinella persica]|uniref:hypothetical protein n=1 Tax=Neolewinella persica TaxID=70998 RepID=UPI00037A43B8|nr:hypothetical protein [Neolewinella persica]
MSNFIVIVLAVAFWALTVFFFYYFAPDRRARFLRRGLVFFSLVAFTAFLIAIYRPANALYTVEARTEYLEFTSTEVEGRLNLTNVKYINQRSPVIDSVSGSIATAPGVKIRLLRIGHGAFSIELSFPGDAPGQLGIFTRTGMSPDTLIDRARIVLANPDEAFNAGKGHLVYFEGKDLQVGKYIAKPPSSASSAVLKEGTVTASDRELLGEDRYESVRYDLGYGETLTFETKLKDGQASGGIGFAVLDGGAGLKMAYNINAENARIGKAGMDKSDKHLLIRPTLLNRFSSDGFLQVISFFFASLLVLTTLWTFYYDTRSYHELKKSIDK